MNFRHDVTDQDFEEECDWVISREGLEIQVCKNCFAQTVVFPWTSFAQSQQ